MYLIALPRGAWKILGKLWDAKAPGADICLQFVPALRTGRGASSADRVGRDPCVPPRKRVTPGGAHEPRPTGSFRRGRRPAVERSGTNALGVRRPVSAAALSFRASDRVTGVGIRIPARQRRAARPPL